MTYATPYYGSVERSEVAYPYPAAAMGNDGMRNTSDDDVAGLYRLFDESKRERLARRIASTIVELPTEMVDRQLHHFDQVHADYGMRVRRALDELRRTWTPLPVHLT